LPIFLYFPSLRIELQFLQKNTALIASNGHDFEHLPLDADKLGELRLANLAAVVFEGIGSDSLVFSSNDPIAQPSLQAMYVHESLTARTLTGRYDEIEVMVGLLAQTNPAGLRCRILLVVDPIVPSHFLLQAYSHHKSLSPQLDDIPVLELHCLAVSKIRADHHECAPLHFLFAHRLVLPLSHNAESPCVMAALLQTESTK